ERVHVKNTGRCKELLIPGATVYLEEGSGANRKTKYDLIAVDDIFTADAHVNVEGLEADIYPNVAAYQGMDRFACRKQIVLDLEADALLEKTEDYTNKVGYSERTNVPIEPRLSLQWFIRMQHFADIALPPVMNDDIVFYPTKYKNTYRNWLENIKDWCISRQLWWGHRIPAFYIKSLLAETGAENYPEDKIIVAPNIEEAAKISGISAEELVQDEGALDTWFSSWLWPISLFDGIQNPGNEEINYYYPTADLVTGPDIIFFWVARMIMAGYEYIGKMPFKHVYFTGIVRDKLGRKMSKSLGNSPDPLDLIERFGADGVRMGMMLSQIAGREACGAHVGLQCGERDRGYNAPCHRATQRSYYDQCYTFHFQELA
ncbi:MAG: class I tRNA ligase family protein, partial [Alistipes sp.]|nr:class I tRNA ligase family protein [Alistipes sp.]